MRKTMRKTVSIMLLVIAFVSAFFTSCSDDIFGTKVPVDIKLSKSLIEYNTISEILGKNLQLEATVTLKDGSKTNDVTWKVPDDTTAFKVHATSGGILTFQISKSGTYVEIGRAHV